MNWKSFPFKWTCLVGACFLGSMFWSAAMLDAGFGFIRFLVCGLCFFTSLVVSLVLIVGNRSRMSLYRFLINLAVCLLFFPVIRAGSLLRDHLFIRHLARFQEVTDTLIANERARANRLTETRDLVHRTAQGLSPEQLQYRPEPGRWSVAENLEHITVVEERILAGLMRTLEQPPDPVKKPGLTDEQLLENFGRVVQPLTAPGPFRPTSRWPLADLLDKFDAARRLTLEFAATAADKDLRRHSMPHPFFGELDCYQWFILVAGHSARHCHQCDRVKESPAFPLSR